MTGYWLKQANGQAYDQTDRQRLAWHLVEVGLDDTRRLALAPFEILITQLRASMLREWGIACSIYTKHAEEVDNVYLGHVERVEGTVRNTMDRIYESEQQ